MSFPNLPPPSASLPARPPPCAVPFPVPGSSRVPHIVVKVESKPKAQEQVKECSKRQVQDKGNADNWTQQQEDTLDMREPRVLVRNFLRVDGCWSLKQHAEQNLHEHGQFLLTTPLGRDFTLVTTDGVEFKVHMTMLLGGSKMLQEGIFPRGLATASPPTFVNLPLKFHPILVDRIVEFIYTGTYDPGNDIRHAAHVPDGDISSDHSDLEGAKFHLHMYSLAETLEFSTLQAHAHQRLADQLIYSPFLPTALANFVDAAFAPRDSELRICADTEHWIQKLVVVGALVQENKYWTLENRHKFGALLVHDDYNAFWDMWEDVEADCVDLMEAGKVLGTRKGGKKKKKMMENTGLCMEKRAVAKKRLLEARAEALVRGLEKMRLGCD